MILLHYVKRWKILRAIATTLAILYLLRLGVVLIPEYTDQLEQIPLNYSMIEGANYFDHSKEQSSVQESTETPVSPGVSMRLPPPTYPEPKLDDISCHYIESDDTLPHAHTKSFRPPSRSIFFHETSCKGDLNSRQACAVESAARAHPHWQINVIFSGPVTQNALETGTFSVLRNLTNVKLFRVHIAKYARGTPLENFISAGALNRSDYKIHHSSDVLRFLSLYKYGGIYLDLDVVVAKPLDTLARNWASRESNDMISSGILAFSRDKIGREVAEEAVRDLGTHFSGDIWDHNGPRMITRVLERRCNGSVKDMSAATCKGFEVYGAEFFNPVHWCQAEVYFNRYRIINERRPYVFHVWNRRTSDIKISPGSPYSRLAVKYCPDIYKSYLDVGGLLASDSIENWYVIINSSK